MGNVAQYPTISDRAVVSYIMQGLEGAAKNSWVPTIANEFTSDQAAEDYAGLGNTPMMREWIGSKQQKQLREYSLRISNKDWESTLRVFRKDLRRDKTGQLQARIGELSQRSVEHEAKLISDLIENGAGTTLGSCYDGKALFADDHSVGDSGTIDNKIDYNVTTTTAPTAAEAAGSILEAITKLYAFKDDTGEPTNQNLRSFMLMVPVPLWAPYAQALTKEALASGQDNPLLGLGFKFQLVANPRLTWTDKFAMFALDTAWKPFIVQTEAPPSVEILGEGSDYAFFNAAHLFSVIKSGNVGYGRFDKAIQVTLT
jgi:phage major head subunit gpT-like protein